jgi:hypothetical protein
LDDIFQLVQFKGFTLVLKYEIVYSWCFDGKSLGEERRVGSFEYQLIPSHLKSPAGKLGQPHSKEISLSKLLK